RLQPRRLVPPPEHLEPRHGEARAPDRELTPQHPLTHQRSGTAHARTLPREASESLAPLAASALGGLRGCREEVADDVADLGCDGVHRDVTEHRAGAHEGDEDGADRACHPYAVAGTYRRIGEKATDSLLDVLVLGLVALVLR